jgi:hypothetical protein
MPDDNNQNYHHDPEEKDRKILLWSGVIFFMALIISLWSFNFHHVVSDIDRTSPGLTDNFGGDPEVSGAIDKMAEQVRSLEDLKNIKTKAEVSENGKGNKKREKLLENLSKELEKNQKER